MCVAMMLPVALPAVKHVVDGSLRRRRPRAAALFVAAYLSVWTAAGLVALPVVSLLQVVARRPCSWPLCSSPCPHGS
jgi:predicted metal-binding membrane protein